MKMIHANTHPFWMDGPAPAVNGESAETRHQAKRATMEFFSGMTPQTKQEPFEDLPLFGGPRQTLMDLIEMDREDY